MNNATQNTGETKMTPTQAQLDALAKIFQTGQTGDEDEWEDLYLDGPDTVTATRDTLDNFCAAAKSDWTESSNGQTIGQGMYWAQIQVKRGERRVSLAVLDCGGFCISYKQ